MTHGIVPCAVHAWGSYEETDSGRSRADIGGV